MLEMPSGPIALFLELGQKRVFAGAIDWPGWCRSGPDEQAALHALWLAAPRFARVAQAAQLPFRAPADVSAFAVVERLQGGSTTDFGAPEALLSGDAAPVLSDEWLRWQALLSACWQTFDAALGAAAGRTLRLGPRGGGRDAQAITAHVLDGDAAYLARLGWKARPLAAPGPAPVPDLTRMRQAILDGLAAAGRGEIAPVGPRGGVRWSPRTFVRRVAWHTLDHAWEIEDRLL